MQKQRSRGTAHVWCDSVSREGSSKFCLLVSTGFSGEQLPISQATGQLTKSCHQNSPWFQLSLVTAGFCKLCCSCSHRSHAHSCSSQEAESLPALGSRPSELKPTQMIFFHFCHRSFVLVFQKPHVLSSLLHHCFHHPAGEMEENVTSNLTG